ncbi:MAG TPA: VWA domain-containing protein, partial [Phycisphaerae bacterium]
MGVTHLWAIFGGLAALGLPLAVHWLTRPRPIRVDLSTLRFVREAITQRKAKHRLRDALILAARLLAVACLALAFARPLVSAASAPAASVERVVVLDVSASMGAVSHGVPAFERARGVAARYLEQSSGLRADLVFAGARPQSVFEHPSANLKALRDELGQANVRPERLDVARTLAAVGEMFGQLPAGAPRREVVIITDLQRSNWGAVDFSPLPKDCQIIVESVAPAAGADIGNL